MTRRQKAPKRLGAITGIFIFAFLCFMCREAAAVELGVTGGMETKETRFTYGLSGSMGFLIPMLKFEIEGYKITGIEVGEMPGGVMFGLKFKPKLGQISPYGVVGVGAEMEEISLDFDTMETYTYIGGGLYYKVAPMISLRADFRFLNFSGYNRIRLTGGIFFQL